MKIPTILELKPIALRNMKINKSNHPTWLDFSFGTYNFSLIGSFEFNIKFWWEMIEQPVEYSI